MWLQPAKTYSPTKKRNNNNNSLAKSFGQYDYIMNIKRYVNLQRLRLICTVALVLK